MLLRFLVSPVEKANGNYILGNNTIFSPPQYGSGNNWGEEHLAPLIVAVEENEGSRSEGFIVSHQIGGYLSVRDQPHRVSRLKGDSRLAKPTHVFVNIIIGSQSLRVRW
jgi:hypothetical protein